MAALLGQLHFWTLKEDNFATTADIGCYMYHNKNATGSHPYYQYLRTFCEDRGVTWCPSNKRPERLRTTLKEVEELVGNLRCVYCAWLHRNCLQLMFNNGTLITIWIKPVVGDIEKIRVDKYLVGKLFSEHIVEVLFCDTLILVSYVEPKLTCIHLTKKFEDTNKKWRKLSNLDPKIVTTDLIGPTGRRLERRLSCNAQNNELMIWWMSSSDEVWPWTPVSTDRERANIHIYTITGSDIKLSCYTRTKADPMWASYSKHHIHQIYTIEQQISRKGEITVDIGIYEISKTKIQRYSPTTIPLGSSLTCHGMNHAENRVLLGCKDGSLVMYDMQRNNTHLTRSGFVPSVIGWHPSGSIVMVGSEKGQIQCYDMALCCLNLEILSEEQNPTRLLDLAIYLKFQPYLQKMIWNPQEYSPADSAGFLDTTHSLLLLIDRGPLTVLVLNSGVYNNGGLSPIELVTEYIKCSQVDEAINLFLNMNWNVESETCYKCLMLIINHLLRHPLTENREVQLEMALGSYYSPSTPLDDVVTLEFDLKVHYLARRFFHHLLRYEKFEKAFLLAADLGAKDLFMDIHYIASDKNEHVLAQVALDRARQLDVQTDSSSTGSQKSNDTREGSTFQDSSSSTSCSSCESEDEDGTFDHIPNSHPLFQSNNSRPSHSKDQQLLSVTNPTVSDFREANYQWPESGIPPIEPSTGTAHGLNWNAGTSTESNINDRFLQTIPDVGEETSEEDEDGHGIVHVVHFGVV